MPVLRFAQKFTALLVAPGKMVPLEAAVGVTLTVPELAVNVPSNEE